MRARRYPATVWLVSSRDEPLELACGGVTRDLRNNAYGDVGV